MTRREELLQCDGVGRVALERRVVALVRVLDAAEELVAADDAAQAATSDVADERYEQAWEQLRSVLKSV